MVCAYCKMAPIQVDMELMYSFDHSQELLSGDTVLAFSTFECLAVVGERSFYSILLLR